MNIQQAQQIMWDIEQELPQFYEDIYNYLDGDYHESDLPPYTNDILHVKVIDNNIVSTLEHHDHYHDGTDPGSFEFVTPVEWWDLWVNDRFDELKVLVNEEWERRDETERHRSVLNRKHSLGNQLMVLKEEELIDIMLYCGYSITKIEEDE